MSYLSDKKCPVQSREQMVVVADDLGILWIPGYTIAERARIEAGANAMMLSCDSNGFMGR